jgi:hypothetical protein
VQRFLKTERTAEKQEKVRKVLSTFLEFRRDVLEPILERFVNKLC